MDSGLTGNYIDAQECAAQEIKVEEEDQAEELKMADGTMVRIEAQVRFILKCGGYKGQISDRVFPNMNKQIIIGNPCLSKKTPTWTDGLDSSCSGDEERPRLDIITTCQVPTE